MSIKVQALIRHGHGQGISLLDAGLPLGMTYPRWPPWGTTNTSKSKDPARWFLLCATHVRRWGTHLLGHLIQKLSKCDFFVLLGGWGCKRGEGSFMDEALSHTSFTSSTAKQLYSYISTAGAFLKYAALSMPNFLNYMIPLNHCKQMPDNMSRILWLSCREKEQVRKCEN